MAGFRNIVQIVQGGGGGDGSTVEREALRYDRPEVVPQQINQNQIALRANESFPALTEDVIAAILAQAPEDNPIPVETIQTTVRPMIFEAVPSQADMQQVALRANEVLPTIVDQAALIAIPTGENTPTPDEVVRITAGVNAMETLPALTENIQAAIIEQDNFLADLATSEPINVTLNGYANQNVATTTWTNPANALGNTTGTASTLTATASGLAGTTNNTATGAITLGFRDVNLGDMTITSVVLSVENQGATAGVAIAQPTTNVQWQYSLNNGGSFTTFYTMTTPATAKGIRTVDITAIVGQDQSLLSALQIRATGTITSGTGLGAANTVSFFRAWMTVLANRTY